MTKLNGFWSENILICFIYIYNNKKKPFVFDFPSYIWGWRGGGINFVCLLFFCLCVFLSKHSCCFILKIYHLRCSLIEQFILTAFIDLKVVK